MNFFPLKFLSIRYAQFVSGVNGQTELAVQKSQELFLNSCQDTEVPPTGLVHLVLLPGSFIIFSVCLLCPAHPWLQFVSIPF